MTIIRGRPSVPGTRNSPLRPYYSTRLLHSLPRYAVPSFLRPWFPLQSTQETLIVYTFHLFCPERVCPPSSHIFSLRISSHCPQSRVVVSRGYWAYRHQDDLADVIEWLVSTGHVTRDAVEAFLLNDNVSRERVDFARVGRVRDAAGQHYALRFSASLDNIRHRHQHDLVRLLEHLVGADAQILAAVEGKLASLNQAQSATRDTLRQ